MKKVCSNNKCYGAKASMPCYTHHELKIMMKKEGKPAKTTKKEMCEALKIPYYTFFTLQRYGGRFGGAYDYPACNIFGSKTTHDTISRQYEGRLFGMLLTNILADCLDGAVDEKVDSKGDEFYVVDFEKFESNLPEAFLTESRDSVPKEVIYVVQKFNKKHKYEFDEETVNKIAKALHPFCRSFVRAFNITARVPFIIHKSTNVKTAFKKVLYGNMEKYWPYLNLSCCAVVLKTVWPEMWENYKWLCYIQKERIELYKSEQKYKTYLNVGCFFTPGIPSYDKRSYQTGQDMPEQELDMTLIDLPYYEDKSGKHYIVPDSYDRKGYLYECDGINLKTMTKGDLIKFDTSVDIYVNGLVVARFYGNDQSFQNYVLNGIPDVTNYDVMQSARKTLARLNIQTQQKIKHPPKILKKAKYSVQGHEKIELIGLFADGKAPYDVFKNYAQGASMKDLEELYNITKDWRVREHIETHKQPKTLIPKSPKSPTPKTLTPKSPKTLTPKPLTPKSSKPLSPKSSKPLSPKSPKSLTSTSKQISEDVFCKPYGKGFVIYGKGTRKVKELLKSSGGKWNPNLSDDPHQGWIFTKEGARKVKLALLFPSETYLTNLIYQIMETNPEEINNPNNIKQAILETLPELENNKEFKKNFKIAYHQATLKKYIVDVDYSEFGSGYLVTGTCGISSGIQEHGKWMEKEQGWYLTKDQFKQYKPYLDILCTRDVV